MSWICYLCILYLCYMKETHNTLKYIWHDTIELENLDFSASYSMTLQPERVKRIILSCLLWFIFILQSFSDRFPVCGHRVSSSSHPSCSPRDGASALLAYHPAVMIKQCCCWGAQSLAEVVSLASWASINHSSSSTTCSLLMHHFHFISWILSTTETSDLSIFRRCLYDTERRWIDPSLLRV